MPFRTNQIWEFVATCTYVGDFVKLKSAGGDAGVRSEKDEKTADAGMGLIVGGAACWEGCTAPMVCLLATALLLHSEGVDKANPPKHRKGGGPKGLGKR